LVDSAADSGFSGSLLVVHRGDTLLDEAFGEAVRGARPFTTDTVSSMGSVTKQFTGAAILAAQEDGLLSVSDTIGRHLDNVPSDKAEITIHQLLTHTSGLRASIGPDEAPIGRDDWLSAALESKLRASPGERFRYSNVGYGVAAAILEDAAGTSYEGYLRERLLVPAGALSTGYSMPDWDEVSIAHGYRGSKKYGAPLSEESDGFWHVVGNGELLTTTADLYRWVDALNQGRVLSDASMEELWVPQVSIGEGASYSYGWGIESRLGNRVIEHDGSNGFFFAHVAWFVEDELFIAFLSNRHNHWQDQFLWDIADSVLRPAEQTTL
jgi:CubicO group peptidase (beta-lactamase class C family)